MKKRAIKLILPITSLLLSSCSFVDWFKGFFGKQEETNEKQENNDNPVNTETYPTSIEIPTSLPLVIDQSKTLEAKLSPSNTTYKTVTWTSSNEEVAKVIDGEVTGVSKGEATVKATTLNDEGKKITSECKVVVTNQNEVSRTNLKYNYDDYMANTYYSSDNTPLTGNPKLLVIPIWFSDSDTFIELGSRSKVREDIEKAYFGSNEETGWRSVKTFYEEESKGEITYDGTVADWYEVSASYTTYGSSSSGQSKTNALVTTASDAYFTDHPSDSRLNYDSNEDGYLDGVILIYAAPDYDNLGNNSYSNLWAYTYWLDDSPSKLNPKPNVFFWASYDFMYSSGTDSLVKTGKTTYGRGDTRHLNVDAHCFIHEMGHVFGLPDYYDYKGEKNAAAGFSMQDMNVGGHDPYSVMAYGWAKPYIPTESTTITINTFQSSNEVILLANHDVDSPFDEYMLIELYSPTGLNKFDSDYAYNDRYPRGPKEVGIRLWHVDARLTYVLSSSWSTTFTTDPNKGNVLHVMSNTTAKSSYFDGHGSPLGKSYAEYNLLQLIRKDNKTANNLTKDSLFGLGSSFSLYDYTSQFVRGSRMNDGSSLNWSFSVEAIDSTSASIKVVKN